MTKEEKIAQARLALTRLIVAAEKRRREREDDARLFWEGEVKGACDAYDLELVLAADDPVAAYVDPNPTIAPPVHDCPSCAALRARVAELEQELEDSEGREG